MAFPFLDGEDHLACPGEEKEKVAVSVLPFWKDDEGTIDWHGAMQLG